MKTQLTFSLLALLFGYTLPAQSLEEFYDQDNYAEVVKFAAQTDTLSADNLYRIGYSYFILENDKKAIEMYDLAIEKGLDEDYVYLFKGLAQRYDKQMDAAAESFRKAISIKPTGQKNLCELGNVFYLTERFDSALVYFRKAREMEYELGDPYLKIPYIYHRQENFTQALEEYKLSASLINKEDPAYLELLSNIGRLEAGVFNNYEKSSETFAELLSIDPMQYEVYGLYIESLNSLGKSEQADSLFLLLKAEYEAKKLPQTIQERGSVSVAKFAWNDQQVIVFKNFKEPTDMLDEIYRIYLLSADGGTVERTLMTEKTIQLEDDGAKHLLCERHKSGAHSTYSYGWSTDSISVESLKKSVLLVLNEEIKPSASSNFGVVDQEALKKEASKGKKKKKKRKKKRNKDKE